MREVKDVEGISDVILLSLEIWMNSNNLLFIYLKNGFLTVNHSSQYRGSLITVKKTCKVAATIFFAS